MVVDDKVDKLIKSVCLDIEKRYEIHFVEIGVDKDHVHFLLQSVPMLSVTRIAATVGKHGNETVIRKYVKERGSETEYIQIHRDQGYCDTPMLASGRM